MGPDPGPRDLRKKAMALRSENLQHRSTDRATPTSRTLPHSLAAARARRKPAQTTDLAPGSEHLPRGLKPYEAYVSERNSEGRVAVGHGGRPKAL